MKAKLTMVFVVVGLAAALVVTTLTPAANNGTANAAPSANVQPAPETATPAERHPRIRAALRELHEAKVELRKAAHDFGGHRVEAVEAIDKAIQQLEVCLKYDKE